MAENQDEVLEEKEDELCEVAMQIILHAGTAKTLADEAFKLAKEKKFDEAYAKLDEAEKEGILKAHVAQYEVIQDEARGIAHEHSLLFTHAQDHLMTIKSEVGIIRKMVELYDLIVSERK